MVVQIYYIKGLLLCQIVVLTSGRSAGTRSCVRGSQQIAICIRLSRTARISRAMSGSIAMGSMRAALLPRFSTNAMGDIRLWSVHIMRVWIAWILPNAIAAGGTPLLLQNGYGNGWKSIAVTANIDRVVFLWGLDRENRCGTRIFEETAADQKCIKSSTKNSFFLVTKYGQNTDKKHYFFSTKTVSKPCRKPALWCKQKTIKMQAISEGCLCQTVGKVLMWDVHSTGRVMGFIFGARGLPD